MESNIYNQNLIYEINIDNNIVDFSSTIESALHAAECEMVSLNETIDSINGLKPECDKLDYALAVSSGAICGILDIFLVGKPGESPLGDITDKWFENRTKDFAKLCGWKDNGENSLSSAIKHLEKKFKIPYDQRGVGDAASFVFDLNPSNHHFKSLAHNPSLLGLFFSILDQFSNTSHFVSSGELISLQKADDKFELRGNNVLSKLFCAFANWFGHLISDMCGSSGSKGRGMGIPSPLWTWINDVIAINRKLNIPVNQFNKSFNELAIELYTGGYDARFQTAQGIPVFINEMFVRLLYTIRRLIKYFSEISVQERSMKLMLAKCKPFKNPIVKRMLTVAHGTFLAIDAGDATIRSFIAGGGYFNPAEFFMRINIVGLGRFTISLYGEIKCGINIYSVGRETVFAQKEKTIIQYYIEGLHILSEVYDDKLLVNLVSDLKDGQYVSAFEKSIKLAEKRDVPQEKTVRDKTEIDTYFTRGKKS